jgi:hypothetical protein
MDSIHIWIVIPPDWWYRKTIACNKAITMVSNLMDLLALVFSMIISSFFTVGILIYILHRGHIVPVVSVLKNIQLQATCL